MSRVARKFKQPTRGKIAYVFFVVFRFGTIISSVHALRDVTMSTADGGEDGATEDVGAGAVDDADRGYERRNTTKTW